MLGQKLLVGCVDFLQFLDVCVEPYRAHQHPVDLGGTRDIDAFHMKQPTQRLIGLVLRCRGNVSPTLWWSSLSAQEKLMVFIDGQNLLYGCMEYARKQKQGYEFRYREEDLLNLLVSLKPNRKLIQTRFYTSFSKQHMQRYEKQRKKLDLLELGLKWVVVRKEAKTYPYYCPRCKHSSKLIQLQCPSCGLQLETTENKGVDVSLATDLLLYGLVGPQEGGYDVAILVSGDRDFAPVIDLLSSRRPAAIVEVAQFTSNVGNELRRAARAFYPLENYADKFGKWMPKKI
jgi:uncharacterized LabA/DUF88 family protein